MTYTRYALVFLAVAIGAGLAVRLLEARISGLGSSAQLIVPAMIAALIEGQSHARTARTRADRAHVWNFTWTATGIATALNLALAYLLGGLLPEFGKLAIAAFASQQFVILLGVYAGAYLVCNRFFFGIGVSTELARQDRRDGR